MPRNGDQKYMNKILRGLPAEDFQSISPHLVEIDLPLRTPLEMRNKPIEFVYFLEHGIASVVAGSGDRIAEVGLIGNEGATGLAVVLGAESSPHETYMQIAGSGHRIAVADLRQVIEQSPNIGRALLRFGHVLTVQAASTALCNVRHRTDERLARWLLMADDRVEGSITLTHEFLAIMLGVGRPVVTIALKLLAERGLISLERREITIVNREGLERAANGSYGIAEAEYRKNFS